LTDRIYRAMVAAWNATRRVPLRHVDLRLAKLELEFHPGEHMTGAALRAVLDDPNETVERRILAAMGLSSRARVEAGRPIDLPCLDLGPAQIVLFPGESFVGYQLMAQSLRPDSFVVSIGYGECWPGYIPTRSAEEDGFRDVWLWVAPGAETAIRAALETVLTPR
jgi:hypothetical protein